LNLLQIDRENFQSNQIQTWERLFDRISKGEMPPRDEPRPDPELIGEAIESLKTDLVAISLRSRGDSRTALRRMTRVEYAYTIQDLLGIEEDVAINLTHSLPAEANTGYFDTLANNQTISPLHIQSYLEAADLALDAALQFGPEPESVRFKTEYVKSGTLDYIAHTKALGLGIVKKVDDAYVSFFDFGSTYTFHSVSEGFHVQSPGLYRIAFDAYPYQPKTSVGLAIYKGKMAGVAASLDELLATFELNNGRPGPYEITAYLRPGDLISPSPFDLDGNPHAAEREDSSQGYDMSNYDGEGVALRSLSIEGPIRNQWPPASTKKTLAGIEFDALGQPILDRSAREHVDAVIADFGPRAFRRPLIDGELQAYASLAYPLLDKGNSFAEAIRVPLRAILTSPDFLYHVIQSDHLNEYELANRISYFLWRSLPDDELTLAARRGTLSDKQVLKEQVQRMINDVKFKRFIKDFADQAYRLNEINDTSPDPGLYPEFDDRLGKAIEMETELFLNDLFVNNLSIKNLIDSDFTYLNRRLAQHYQIAGIDDHIMQRVTLPEDSIRGGLITQASILKITANGTNTSPVVRGNFLLAHLIGDQTPPPPPGVGNIEPDTRGTTTMRQQLDAHRANTTCNSCHCRIDPPGFALESFDPIGNYRTRYRVSGGMIEHEDYKYPAPYKQGLNVDSSGQTADGAVFNNIDDYKKILLDTKLDQIAKNFTTQLFAFSTGASIQFADRDAVQTVLAQTRDNEFRTTDIIQFVIQSDLFRTK
jgi:hypothetical protein